MSMNNRQRSILARIHEIERSLARPMREAIMGDQEALFRVTSGEAEIAVLRERLADFATSPAPTESRAGDGPKQIASSDDPST